MLLKGAVTQVAYNLIEDSRTGIRHVIAHATRNAANHDCSVYDQPARRSSTLLTCR